LFVARWGGGGDGLLCVDFSKAVFTDRANVVDTQ
jgi:hypothetical protein